MNQPVTLNDLLHSDSLFLGNAKKSLEELGLHANYAYPAMALFAINVEEADVWIRRTIIHKLYSLIKEHAPCNCAVLLNDADQVFVIFSWDDRETINHLYRNMINGNFPSTPNSIAVGISNPTPLLADLSTCYEQALFAVKHRFYQHDSQPIYFNSIEPYANSVNYPEDKEDDLLLLVTGDHAEASIQQAVDAFYEALFCNGPLPAKKVNDATLQLLISLQLRMKSSHGQSQLCSTPDMTALMQLQTLKELKKEVCEAINQMRGTACVPERVNHTLIKKAVTLMEEEYDRASLHYVAGKMFITPVYLSALFKSDTGVTFIEHLTQIRISNAKKLLKHTHLKNYEVAEKVGYHDSRYFSQIFKKKVGLSPSEFRDAN